MQEGAAVMRGAVARPMRRRRKWSWNRALLYALALGGSFMVAAPIYWIVAQSLMTESQIFRFPPYLVPPSVTFNNYRALFTTQDVPIIRWFINSTFVAISSTVLQLIVASLAAYAYARLEFPGRDKLFYLLLSTMMIPGQVTLIPAFLIIRDFHWIDTYHALIWPSAASVFAVFLLRQFFQTIPLELEEAAILDGCSRLGVYRHVIIPLSTAALSALAIFHFMASWNALFWPLIVTNSLNMRTLPVGLTLMMGTYYQKMGLVMAGATVSVIPVLVFYAIFQRRIIEGITLTGLSGV